MYAHTRNVLYPAVVLGGNCIFRAYVYWNRGAETRHHEIVVRGGGGVESISTKWGGTEARATQRVRGLITNRTYFSRTDARILYR